ncbi:putative monooxygenase [Janthinobacterium sp. CG23_2]|nr:putative monooxygenase [Janthinobacterium sp. CG23_2]CUU32065.1 putative monooxygenase [Janthinobacterium sp. CG23_2]
MLGQHAELAEEGGHLRQAYGVNAGDWVLVRPDGYVGAIVRSAGPEALAGYFEKVGLGPLPARA